MYEKLWDNEEPIETLGVSQPLWVEYGLSPNDIVAIYQGGCASGAYMPAVTYHKALNTMHEYGNDVLEYLEDSLGKIPQPVAGSSWPGIAVFYLSMAVELFAANVIDEIDEILE